MNILWIPHNSWGSGRYQRDQYFIRYLKEKHKIHVLLWGDYLPHSLFNLINPLTYYKNLRFNTKIKEGIYIHQLPRLPNIMAQISRIKLSTLRINQFFLDRLIKHLSLVYNIQVIITGNIGEQIPLPFNNKIPVIIDYVDWPHWSDKTERDVLKKAHVVIAVSEPLLERAISINRNSYLISNGADVEKLKLANGHRIREKYSLEKSKVVSLIGLTYSGDYFIDAILLAKKEISNIKCILVGESAKLKQRLEKDDYYNGTFIYVGPVSYPEVLDYFAATDVGLYPVDETFYYDAASPIKVFEYTAAQKPVVLPRIKQMLRLGFPNLIFSPPDKYSFADSIIRAITKSVEFSASINDYDWQILAGKLEKILFSL